MLWSILALTLTASAGLAASGNLKRGDTVYEHEMVTTPEGEQRVRDYWTRERIASIDHDPIISPPYPNIPDDERHIGAAFEGEGAIPKTVGRLLYSEPYEQGWRDSSCTATLLQSTNEATIVTAGHCLKPGKTTNHTAWHTNVLFLPGFRDNKPQVNFTLNRSFLPSSWVDGPENPGDYYFSDRAFAVLNIGSAKEKTARAGLGLGQKIQFEKDATDFPIVYNLGYPRYVSGLNGTTDIRKGTPAFTGLRLAACYGKAEKWWRFPSNKASLPCTMSGGCSGGPTLAEFDFDRGIGFVTTVNSLADLNGFVGGNATETIMTGSSVTDGFAKQLFEAAQAADPTLT